MRGLIKLMFVSLLSSSCIFQPTSDDADVAGENQEMFEGSWFVTWGPSQLQFASSCTYPEPAGNYFSEPIPFMTTDAAVDGTLSVDVGGFPEEIPCDLGPDAQYIGSCLDDDPYSTTMMGDILFDGFFSAEKHYGVTEGTGYKEWLFQLTGTADSDTIQGEADMKIIDGMAGPECRIQMIQNYTATRLSG